MRLPEQYRYQHLTDDLVRIFKLPPFIGERWLICVYTRDGDWDHVSVQVLEGGVPKTPVWDEMRGVVRLFWNNGEEVIQFHPSQAEFRDWHPHILHLWYHPTLNVLPLEGWCDIHPSLDLLI